MAECCADTGSCVVAALWNVVEVRGLSVVLILAAFLEKCSIWRIVRLYTKNTKRIRPLLININ